MRKEANHDAELRDVRDALHAGVHPRKRLHQHRPQEAQQPDPRPKRDGLEAVGVQPQQRPLPPVQQRSKKNKRLLCADEEEE